MRKYLIQMLNKILKEKQITIQSMANEIKKSLLWAYVHICVYLCVCARVCIVSSCEQRSNLHQGRMFTHTHFNYLLT